MVSLPLSCAVQVGRMTGLLQRPCSAVHQFCFRLIFVYCEPPVLLLRVQFWGQIRGREAAC